MADITSNLVLWAPLTETSGTAIRDATGLHAAGTFAGTLSTIAAPSQFGGLTAINFNGTNNDVTFSNASDLQSTGDQTITAWVKTSTASTLWLYANSNAAFNAGHEVGINAGSFAIVARPVGLNAVAGTPDFNNGAWRHVAFVYVSTAGSVVGKGYIDGALVYTSGSAAWTPTSNSDPIRLGSRRGAGWWAGGIFDFRHYRRALTDADVAALHAWAPHSGGGPALSPVVSPVIPAGFSPSGIPLTIVGG